MKLIIAIDIPDGLTGWDAYQSIAQSNIPHHRGGPDSGDITPAFTSGGVTGAWYIRDDDTLPALLFEPGDSANLACQGTGHAVMDQHTLCIQNTDENKDPATVYVSLIHNGQPQGGGNFRRADLVAQLGGVL